MKILKNVQKKPFCGVEHGIYYEKWSTFHFSFYTIYFIKKIYICMWNKKQDDTATGAVLGRKFVFMNLRISVCMFVVYRLKNYSTDFDKNFRDCSWKYQECLKSSLNYVR